MNKNVRTAAAFYYVSAPRQKAMTTKLRYSLTAVSALLVACRQGGDTEVAGSATAQMQSDGTLRTKAASKDEVNSVSRTAEALKSVDERYPRSEPPYEVAVRKVAQVSEPGIIQLGDGVLVRMDGIRCDSEGVEYLSRILRDEAVSVAIIPSVSADATPIPADVWIRDESSAASSPSYSNVIETAITSRWCSVEPTQTCRHNDRYAALARAFKAVP